MTSRDTIAEITHDGPIPPTPYTVEQYAAALDCCKQVVYSGVRRGLIPSIKIGRTVKIPRDAGDRILREGLPMRRMKDPR